jgi:hypothetical protein
MFGNLLQSFLEFRTRTDAADPNSDAAPAGHGADFLHAAPFDFQHRDHEPVCGQKLAHGRSQQLAGAFGFELPIVVIVVQPFENIFAEFRKSDFVPASFLFAQMIERGVNGDAAEPVLKGSAAIVLRKRFPGFNKGFLSEIFKPMRVAFVAGKNNEHVIPVTPDDFSKVIRRAVPDPFEKFGFVVVRHGRIDHGQRTALLGKLLAEAVDGSINEVVHLRGHLLQLVALFRGQDGRDLAIELETFNRQVGFDGGDFC